MFFKLKELRRKLADARKLPAYVVFSDFTLLEMARLRPSSEAELLAISGVGPKKLEQYGAEDGGGSSASFAEFIHNETVKWSKIIKDAHVTLDS